ncbi:MAG TPA: ABC transporter ATP-binding protein [Anaerolineae bacterium]|nr:ABC transporter ATP-binding protein [Anaerolineae bacterium]
MGDEKKEVVVRLEGITKEFEEGGRTRAVLKGVDEVFYAGDFSLILGQSGSGKSTLLNLISGIDKPTAGDVVVRGEVITKMKERERTLFRRDHIGFIFQFFNLIPTLTVLENVTLPQELAGVRGGQALAKGERLLAQVGLAGREGAFPDKLSGGEQQRVAIARALAHDPMLVLADEPTGNLDVGTGDQVLELLLNLTRLMGKSLVMVTHNEALVPMADRVFDMRGGQLTLRAGAGRKQAAGEVA